jgi:GNAT superfamily N-acetyltransferase
MTNEKHYTMELRIKKLETQEELYATYPFVAQLTPDLSEASFRTIQDKIMDDGYQCIGAFDTDGTMHGMCGYWIRHRFYCGKGLHIDNIASTGEMHGRGIGTVLMDWIVAEATAQGCDNVVLDTYLENKDAHAFYLKHQLRIAGLHFMRKL